MLLSGVLLSTYRTYVRGFSRVPQHMVCVVFFASERFFANLASMGRFSGVHADVVHQMLFPGEILAAELAFVGRVTGVTPKVILQMLFPPERFAAYGTGVWLVRICLWL